MPHASYVPVHQAITAQGCSSGHHKAINPSVRRLYAVLDQSYKSLGSPAEEKMAVGMLAVCSYLRYWQRLGPIGGCRVELEPCVFQMEQCTT